MKRNKILICLLVALLAVTLVVAVACDLIVQGQPAEPEIVGISVFGAIEAYVDEFDYGDYTITVFYSDKTTESVPLSESYLSQEDQAKLTTEGTHTVTVTYEGVSTLFSVLLRNHNSTKEMHTVTFKQEGQADKTVSVFDGEALPNDQIPTPVEVAGYLYTWDLTDVDLTCITSDITVNAVRTAIVYTITYHLFGGENNPDNPTTYTCESDTITLQDPEARELFMFEGWFTSQNFSDAAITEIPTGSYGNLDLYAKWGSLDGFKFAPVDGGYSVTGYDGTASVVVIPSTYLDEAVISISGNAFANTIVTEVTIPASVISIGGYAFSKCNDLQKITVASDNPVYTSAGVCVIEIATGKLIAGCKNSVIPDDGSVTAIGSYAFAYCGELTSIVIPASVTSIDSSAFSSCSNLQAITIERDSQLQTIGSNAFSNCGSLTGIAIPASVTLIDKLAFMRCGDLQTVTFENDSQLQTINDFAFFSCTSLTSLTIPASVTTIRRNAFRNCSGLQTVTFEQDSQLQTISESVFYQCTGLTSVTLPESVTLIDRHAFSYCRELTSITIPASVTSISTYAFASCSNLRTVTFGEHSQLQTIDYEAFRECSQLQTIALGNCSQLQSINGGAFYGCTDMTSITIPSSVTSIGKSTFLACSSLQTVYYGGTAEQWEAISIDADSNETLATATRYYYSETPEVGKWHFDSNGAPTLWTEEDLQ